MRKILLITLLLFSLSAKAQVDNSFSIDLISKPVSNTLYDDSRVFALKIYRLIADEKINIYNDSLLNNVVKKSNLKDKIYTRVVRQIINPFHNDSTDLIDTIFFSEYEGYFIKINIKQNILKFHVDEKKSFFLNLNSLKNLLDDSAKLSLDLYLNFLDGNIQKESFDSFSNKYLIEKTHTLFELLKKHKLTGYSDWDFKTSIKDTFLNTETSNNLYGLQVWFNSGNIKNMSFHMEINSIVILQNIDTTINESWLFYNSGKPYDPFAYIKVAHFFETLSKPEKYLWELIIASNLSNIANPWISFNFLTH